MQDLLDESACENDARARCFKYTQTEGATLITKAINLLCVPHCHLIALNSSNGHTLKAVFFSSFLVSVRSPVTFTRRLFPQCIASLKAHHTTAVHKQTTTKKKNKNDPYNYVNFLHRL